MFDVIMFLIENYPKASAIVLNNRELLTVELEMIADFSKIEIQNALNWLAGLEHAQKNLLSQDQDNSKAAKVRYYMPYEQNHITPKGVDLLCNLERIGILNHITRELVIDRLMALQEQQIDEKTIKWVVSIVLYHEPATEAQLWLEKLLASENINFSESFH